ncbi:MAG: DUF1573 domain-containing protein [Thermodesulfobacteriota bacterium]
MRFVTTCLWVWLGVIVLTTDALATPVLSADAGEKDLGEVRYGDAASAMVPLRNKGQALLEITRLTSTCGCTTATVTRKQLAPGEQAELTISFNARGIEPGRKTQSVFVHSNDPQNPVTQIRTFVTVVQEVRIEPSQLLARVEGVPQQLNFPMKVTNAWDRPLMLQVASARGAVTRAQIEPDLLTVEPAHTGEFTLHVRLHGPPDAKFFKGAVLFKTNHSKEDAIVVHVLVRAHGSKK